MTSMRRKVLGRALAAGVAAGTGGVGYLLATDEGSRRAATFYLRICPIYCHYRTIQLLNRDLGVLSDERADEMYEVCHEKYTAPVKNLTFEMRGFYLKQAQMISTQDDFVPKAYMSWVKQTQDCIPSEFAGTQAREYVAAKLKEELQLDFDDVFASFDDAPIGVASIGQVHRAVLRKSGKEVAVKFLVPGIESKFRGDIKTIRGFCEFALPQHVPAFAEIERQFCTEFDYRGEAQNLALIRNNLREKYKDRIEIPEPHLDLCSKHILVMEFLDGVNFVAGVKEQFSRLAALQGKSLDEMMQQQRDLMQSGKFKFQTMETKAREAAAVNNMLKWGDFFSNSWRLCYNLSVLRLVYGPADYVKTEPPIDLGSTMDLLCKVHAHQIFVDGAFNGDCHPGNFLLLKDGRIGLIDMGQVKHLTVEDRVKYAKLMVAHSRKDKDEVVRIHFDLLGVKTKYRNADIAYRFSAFMNDRDSPEIMQGLNISSFSDYCEKVDPILSLPDNFLMAQRASLLLRGLGKAFGIKIEMSQAWLEPATKFLKEHGEGAYVMEQQRQRRERVTEGGVELLANSPNKK